MNALGVSVEQARGRPVMSRLHAFFSIGNLVGALVVVVLGRLLAEDTATHVLAVERWRAARRAARRASARRTPVAPRRVTEDGSSGKIPAVAWLLAAMAVCFGLTEGTAIDWSSLHVAEVGEVSPSAGAWGLACVAGFMVVIRLLGDMVVERLGRAVVVQGGSVCALVGYLFTAFSGDLPSSSWAGAWSAWVSD